MPFNSQYRPWLLLVGTFIFAGCQIGGENESGDDDKSRPVNVATLKTLTLNDNSMLVNASVDAWKTDNISAEVTGQIEWLEAQNAFINGTDKQQLRGIDVNAENDFRGDPVARIDNEAYLLQVNNAQNQIDRTQQKIKASEKNIESLIPAQIRAALSEQNLADLELKRSQKLLADKATSQAEVDRYQAKYDNAESTVVQLRASLDVEKINLKSLEIELSQNEKALKDANINLRNCVVYSRFSGQLTSVEAVSGSNVKPGETIATIQMMDPIKIEFEVSSETSRLLRRRKDFTVYLPNSTNGKTKRVARLYEIDAVADPKTRTHTVKLLMVNQKLNRLAQGAESSDNDSEGLEYDARTLRSPVPLDLPFFVGVDGERFVDEKSGYALEDWIVDVDGSEPFILKVEEYEEGTRLPENRILTVEKVPVKVDQKRQLFYGDFYYRQVTILDPGKFNPLNDFIVPKLEFNDSQEDKELEKVKAWVTNKSYQVLVDDGSQWQLQPGNLVEVDIGEQSSVAEMRVPMSAVLHENGSYFLFLIKDSANSNDEGNFVERKEVVILDDFSKNPMSRTSTTLRIRSKEETESLEGRQYVTRGAHYLFDSEKVRIVTKGN